MANNVFGTAVTGGNRIDRAAIAQQDPNADNKRDKAIAYVRKQKEKFGNGVSTLCIFYNATGATLRYKGGDSKDGHIFDDQSYPAEVYNGQWGAFLHVKDAKVPLIMATGTMAYAVYFVKSNINEGFCNCLIGWETPWNFHKTDDNGTRAFCDVYDDGEIGDKNEIYNNIHASDRLHTVLKKGMWMTTTIESDTSPLFEAYFKLEAALD